MAFSPNSGLVAVANRGSDSVSVYSVGAGGSLTPVSGSPFATAAGPASVAFSPNGSLLAVADRGSNAVSTYSVSPSGSLTPVAYAGTGSAGGTWHRHAFTNQFADWCIRVG